MSAARRSRPAQLGDDIRPLGFAFRQDSQVLEGVFEINQRADFLARERQALSQGAILLMDGHHLAGDLIQAFLAVFDLARGGAFPNEPAPVNLRGKVAVGVIAADEALPRDGGAVGAEVVESIALDVVAEKEVDEGAGGGVIRGDFRGEESGAWVIVPFGWRGCVRCRAGRRRAGHLCGGVRGRGAWRQGSGRAGQAG